MKIHIDDIPEDGIELGPDQTAAALVKALQTVGEPQEPLALACEMQLSRLDEVVSVTGALSGQLHLKCSRCLEPVDAAVDAPFRFYLRSPFTASEGVHVEVELSEQELDYGFLDAGQVDVESLVREQLLLEMPSHVVCREDCKGICQGCGAELNSEPCRCPPPVADPRLAVLKQWKGAVG